MKNEKVIFLWVLLILVVGMISCSSGGSSSGTSTPATTTTTTTTTTTSSTDALVGTWRNTTGDAGDLVIRADGTGNGGAGFHNWKLNGTTFTFNLDSNGALETFSVVFDDANKNGFTFTNLNPATPNVSHYVRKS
jgi:hypothetical protein